MSHKCTLILAACLTGFYATSMAQTVVPLPYELIIKTIFVSNGTTTALQTNYPAEYSSFNSTGASIFQQATQRVYAQAGIRIVWESPASITSPANYTISNNATTAQNQIGNLASSATGTALSPNALYLFVTGPTSTGTLGFSQESLQGNSFIPSFQNVASVSETIFNPASYYSLTTIAHEIGHVLGLAPENGTPGAHTVIGPSPAFYTSTPITDSASLMITGLPFGGGSVGATSLSQITADGATGVGILTANEKALMFLEFNGDVSGGYNLIHDNPNDNPVGIRDLYTYSAIPEPSTYVLAMSALAGLYAISRRRTARRADLRVMLSSAINGNDDRPSDRGATVVARSAIL